MLSFPMRHIRRTAVVRPVVVAGICLVTGAMAVATPAAATPSPSPSGSTTSASSPTGATPTSAPSSSPGTTTTPSAGGGITASPTLEPTAGPTTGKDPVPRVIVPNFPAGGPGPAGPPIDTVAPKAAAVATYTPCSGSGASAADVALATAIRPWLTGGLAAQSDTSLAESVSCARVIVATVLANKMDRQAAVIALATTVVESGMKNVTYGDRDSLGLFQQRPSQGWGTPAQVQDPVYATNAFLTAMRRNYPNDAWQFATAGSVAQGVQISAFPDRYEPQAADGVQLVSRLWTESSQLFGYSASSGQLVRSAPANCLAQMCSTGTTLLDGNSNTTAAVTGYGTYEFQARTGQIWRSTGTACSSGAGCPGWTQLSRDPRTTAVAAGLGGVYQYQASTGSLYQYTGSPCTSSCSGWRLIDKNPATTRIAANSTGVYQFQGSTGQLWRYTGKPCQSSGACTGWQLVSAQTPGTTFVLGPANVIAYDRNSGKMSVASSITCTTWNCFTWRLLDTDPLTTTIISAKAGLYKYSLYNHQIARWNGGFFPVIDRNPATTNIYGGATTVYQVHAGSGEVWSTAGGTACTASGCPSWVKVTVRPGTTAVSGT